VNRRLINSFTFYTATVKTATIMGASSTTCMSVARTTSTEIGINTSKRPVKEQKEERLVDESFAVWVGEWTYIVRNEVHSFDITVKDGKLYYLEDMGMATVRGKVSVKGTQARIVAKKMNFEILLDRKKMIARYRNIGSKKWTKEISVLKVDEIDSDIEPSCDWHVSTLQNTWRNQSMRDNPSDGSCVLKRSQSRNLSARGSSMRRADSLKYIEDQPSEDSADISELVRRNTSRRSIRFTEDTKKELLELYDSEM